MQKVVAETAPGPVLASSTVLPVVLALGFAHLLNDMMQSLLPAIYPIIKTSYHLDFGQVGLITLTFQLTASLAPLVQVTAVSPKMHGASCWPARAHGSAPDVMMGVDDAAHSRARWIAGHGNCLRQSRLSACAPCADP